MKPKRIEFQWRCGACGELIDVSAIEEQALARAKADEDHVASAVPIERIIGIYHEKLPTGRRVIKRTKARDAHIRARWREYPALEWFEAYFVKVAASKFLTGRTNGSNGRRPFQVDLDWLMRPDNMAKVLEGKYR